MSGKRKNVTERTRDIFARQDAGPWTCPQCKAVIPWDRAPSPVRRENIARDARENRLRLGGDVEYTDGSFRCLCCFSVTPPQAGPS